jgi:hypothetical protein
MSNQDDSNTFGDYLDGEEGDSVPDGDGIYDIGWGYGIINGVWDVGQRAYREIKNKSPKYTDGRGNAKTFPQDDNISRRAFLGVTRDTALGVVALGAVDELTDEDSASTGQQDDIDDPVDGAYTPEFRSIVLTDSEMEDLADYARENGNEDMYHEVLSQANDDGFSAGQRNVYSWNSGDPILRTAVEDGDEFAEIDIPVSMYQEVEQYEQGDNQ